MVHARHALQPSMYNDCIVITFIIGTCTSYFVHMNSNPTFITYHKARLSPKLATHKLINYATTQFCAIGHLATCYESNWPIF